MAKFEDNWNPPYKPSTKSKISSMVNNPGPLKPRLNEGTRLLRTQSSKMSAIMSKMAYRDKKLLEQVAAAKQSGNMYQARLLANELAQVRKTHQMMQHTKALMERTETRFESYDGIGDVAVTVEPILSLMKDLKSSLGGFLPSANSEISQMVDTLGGYMEKTNNQMEFGAETVSVNDEIEGIMTEAAAVASDSVGDRFPSMPAETGEIKEGHSTI